MRIVDPERPATLDRASGPPHNYVSSLRARNLQNGIQLVGGYGDSLGCFLGEVPYTGDFEGTAWSCGYQLQQITVGDWIIN